MWTVPALLMGAPMVVVPARASMKLPVELTFSAGPVSPALHEIGLLLAVDPIVNVELISNEGSSLGAPLPSRQMLVAAPESVKSLFRMKSAPFSTAIWAERVNVAE